MSRERRWWGVPRSFAGFSFWRLSNPFDTEEVDSECKGKREVEVEVTLPEVQPELQSDENTHQRDRSLSRSVERSPSRKLERSRSRSSSFSFKSRKSVDRDTPEVETVEVKKNVLPDISFTFFAEQDREDEYVVIKPSVKMPSDVCVNSSTPVSKRKSEINCTLENNLQDCECTSDRSSSKEDDRVQRVDGEDVEKEDVRHVSSVVVTMKPANYSNAWSVNEAVENIVKENDYEVLRERVEPAYSSPRVSSVECCPVYATVDKSQAKQSSTSDSTSSKDFVEALPFVASTDKSSTLDSVSSKDFREALPSVPLPDWDEISETSEYNADYAELSTPIVTPEPLESEDQPKLDLTEVIHNMEYCQHRAELKPSRRRVTLLRCKKNVKRTPSIGKMKNKLGKAWKKVRGWWVEERIRLNEVMLKRESVREPSVESGVLAEDCRSVSEEEVGLVGREDVMSACSTMPVRHRRNRGRSLTPVLSRSSSIAAFRRSRFFPEVNRFALIIFQL